MNSNLRVNFTDQTEFFQSCSVELGGEFWILGGVNHRNQVRVHTIIEFQNKFIVIEISKIINCDVTRVGDMPFEFWGGACDVFTFGQPKILVCFAQGSQFHDCQT